MRTVIKANVQRRSVNINILGLGRTAPTSCKRPSLVYPIRVSQDTDSELVWIAPPVVQGFFKICDV